MPNSCGVTRGQFTSTRPRGGVCCAMTPVHSRSSLPVRTRFH
ncbi:hypothetical protein BIW11_08190 [Tropilaelaps mercedesae]|uniref:Uncharacterized protein n=1 Tax=Tropilaelaps mercedesae TaxID=418985 RepID=A0A1V9XR13_9ACAR|nr:hypothetical protein BIW11_08190 [Tropilaelaps mercedesae]